MYTHAAESEVHPLADVLRRMPAICSFNYHLRMDMEYSIRVCSLQTVEESTLETGVRLEKADKLSQFYTNFIENSSISTL